MTAINALTSDNNASSTGASGTADYRSTTAPASASSGSSLMSFDDFLDMINPLEHIPIASSIYRAVTGETINPIARIAGDTLYGGVFGLASAGLSALGAAGDEAFASLNDGKSLSETVVASLFGDDKLDGSPDVQLAKGDNTIPDTQLGILQTPSSQSPILQSPDETSMQMAALSAPPATQVASVTPASPNQSGDNSSAPTNLIAQATSGKAFPIDRSKQPYGGVMDTATVQNAQQNQALAMAMAGQGGMLSAQRQLRNSRFAVNNPTAAGTSTTSITAGNDLPAVKLDPSTESAMQNMLKELQAMKGTSQYQSTAQSTPMPGLGILGTSVNSVH